VLAGPLPTDIAQQQAAVQQAQAALQQAEDNLAKATLTAPIDGVVTAVNIKPGDLVGTASASGAISILNNTGLYLQATIGETDFPNVKVGQQTVITVDALPNQRFVGHVSAISLSPTVTQGVVTYTVLIALDTTQDLSSLAPGMTATAAIVTTQHPNVLVVPSRAVQRQGGQQVVQVWVDGHVQTRPVTTGLTANNLTEITSGLHEGDLVVVPTTGTTSTSTPTANPPRGFGGGGAFGGPGR